MLSVVVWLAIGPPEVRVEVSAQVQIAGEESTGEGAPSAAPVATPPAAEHAPRVYTFLPEEEGWDVILTRDSPVKGRYAHDRRAWLFSVRRHFMRELVQLAHDDLKAWSR